jgi:hypothetical protein
MAGTRLAERERWDEIGQIRLEQGDRITHVLFSRLGFPYQAEIEAIAPTALLVDMWGEVTELRAEGGMYRVDLPKSDCSQPIADYCMIGGETYFLIQAADGGELGSRYPEPLPDAAPLNRGNSRAPRFAVNSITWSTIWQSGGLPAAINPAYGPASMLRPHLWGDP